MTKSKINLTLVNSPSASQKGFKVPLPLELSPGSGLRIHQLHIGHGYSSGTNTVAAAATNIAEIRFFLDNRIQRVFSGTQLRDLLLLNGTAYDFQGTPNANTSASGETGVNMMIPFALPWVKDKDQQDIQALALKWAGGGYGSAHLEFDFGAATAPTLVVGAVVDDFVPSQQLPLSKIKRITPVAGGTLFNAGIGAENGRLTQLSLYPDSGASNAATKVTLKRGSKIWQEFLRTANFAHLTNNGMTPTASGRTASVFDIVPDHDDLLASGVPLDADLTAQIEAASAMSGTVTGIIQTYGLPD